MKVIQDFLNYLTVEKGYSQQTISTYRDSLESFQIFFRSLDDQLTWESISTDVVRRWMVTEMERGKGARTVAKDLSALRTLYKYLLQMQRIEKDPVRILKNPKIHEPLPVFLKQSEVDRLFDGVTFPESFEGLRDRTILLTFYHTGVRVSELVGINVADVRLDEAELKVTGKRNKQRLIPFGSELLQAFRYYLSECSLSEGPLFITSEGNRLTRYQVESIVKKYLSLVTTQSKKSPHVLRHTFATAMLNNGADLESIKELLGHESISTTEVYTHTTFADLKKEYKLAHPRA